MRTLLKVLASVIFLCSCSMAVWAGYVLGHGVELDTTRVAVVVGVAILSGVAARQRLPRYHPPTNSELRRIYYPDYVPPRARQKNATQAHEDAWRDHVGGIWD